MGFSIELNPCYRMWIGYETSVFGSKLQNHPLSRLLAQGKIFSLDEAFLMVIDYYIVTSFQLITSFQTLPRSELTAAGSWKLSFRERIDCDSSTGHPYVSEKHLFECPFWEAKRV